MEELPKGTRWHHPRDRFVHRRRGKGKLKKFSAPKDDQDGSGFLHREHRSKKGRAYNREKTFGLLVKKKREELHLKDLEEDAP